MTSTFAYLDAGTAALLLQILGGGVAALAVTIKLFWRRILKFLHIRTDDPDAPDADAGSRPDAP